jgi:hypothetical protein
MSYRETIVGSVKNILDGETVEIQLTDLLFEASWPPQHLLKEYGLTKSLQDSFWSDVVRLLIELQSNSSYNTLPSKIAKIARDYKVTEELVRDFLVAFNLTDKVSRNQLKDRDDPYLTSASRRIPTARIKRPKTRVVKEKEKNHKERKL